MPSTTVTLVTLLLLLVTVTSARPLADDCAGSIGEYSYSLAALAQATKGELQSVEDARHNTYYYRPCNTVPLEQCVSTTNPDEKPAVCQLDDRKPQPQYHDCGSVNSPVWSPRNAGDQTGFFIKFLDGEIGRTTDIEFICDRSAGIGKFETRDPTEQPFLAYHLKWRSAYACPVNSAHPSCCMYQSPSKDDIQYTCSLGSCPNRVGNYQYAGNTTVPSCNKCGTPQRNCCFYAHSDGQSSASPAVSNCVISLNGCPSMYQYNGCELKLDTATVVGDCNDCYISK